MKRNGIVFLVSKVLTRSDLDDNLNRVLLPKKLVIENVCNFLTMKEWEDVNKTEEGIEKHGLNIGDKLNVWGRRDVDTNGLQFKFTFDRQ
ncbi:hypothetical protein AMTR_s00036p00218680 [Amborella trichopoda]|uniref:TF-B3 domain-containing protein n=1 Tax=Amborella trichopoda TaxID=13333 RepID=U5CQH8_AMBTC|nr:hypothetical protein AMTR_s00036p00218680 [Amborella trichopoda]